MTFIFQQLPDQLWDKYDDSVCNFTIAFLQTHQPAQAIKRQEVDRGKLNVAMST